MVDFVPFSDEEDLVRKSKYYLEHDGERGKLQPMVTKKPKVCTQEKYFGKNC